MPEKTQPPAPKLHDLFVTRLYRAEKIVPAKLNNAIEALAMSLAVDDEAGLKWCEVDRADVLAAKQSELLAAGAEVPAPPTPLARTVPLRLQLRTSPRRLR